MGILGQGSANHKVSTYTGQHVDIHPSPEWDSNPRSVLKAPKTGHALGHAVGPILVSDFSFLILVLGFPERPELAHMSQ
jgi:hypothetical protein